jgi:hypothetical protein
MTSGVSAAWSVKTAAKRRRARTNAQLKMKHNQKVSWQSADCHEVLGLRLSVKMWNEYESRMKNSFI